MSGPSPRSPSPTRPLDVRGLLTIDVAAELTRVPGAALDGPWQLAAELVRGLLRLGAQAIRLTLDARRLELEGEGAVLPEAQLQALGQMLTRDAPPSQRHRALLDLEAGAAADLLVLARIATDDLTIESPTARLLRRRQDAPRIGPGRPHLGVRVALSGNRFDVSRARAWLRQACRFAPQPVLLGGRDIRSGFGPDSLDVSPLEPPLRGWLSLPRRGDSAIVWLLRDGVVLSRVTLPGLACFEAAVEMSGHPGSAGPAGAREAFASLRPSLEAQALERTAGLFPQAGRRTSDEAQRLRLLLLSWAGRRSPLPPRVLDAAAFPAYDGGLPQAERLLSLRQIRDLAAAAGGDGLTAVFPGRERAHLPVPGPVLVLNAHERAALARAIALTVHPPGSRPTDTTRRERLAAAGRRVAARLARMARRAWPGGLAGLAAEQLTPGERRLLDRLQEAVGPGVELGLCRGCGPVVQPRPGRWLLPRGSRLVRASVRAVSADPSWTGPAARALFWPFPAGPWPGAPGQARSPADRLS